CTCHLGMKLEILSIRVRVKQREFFYALYASNIFNYYGSLRRDEIYPFKIVHYFFPYCRSRKFMTTMKDWCYHFNSLFFEKHTSEFIIYKYRLKFWNRITYLCCPQRMDIYIRYRNNK